MGWLKKQLKRTTKILDPVGSKLRKSTGGSYMDPMNWYQSKPNQTQPWEARKSPGLMAQPTGPVPQGQSFGQNTGGYNYVQNQFAGQPPPAPNAPPPMSGGGAMSFGGGAPPQMGMSGPRDALAQQMQMQQQPQRPVMQNPQMQQQMMRIGAIRGSMV